jgi:hypothetical protein
MPHQGQIMADEQVCDPMLVSKPREERQDLVLR